MKLCMNEATTMPALFEEEIPAYAEAGFRYAELWFNKVDPYISRHGLQAARRFLDDHGVQVAGMIGIREFLLGTKIMPMPFALDNLERRLEECQALGAEYLDMEPLPSPAIVPPDAMKIASERLAMAAERARKYNVQLSLEFIRMVAFNNNLDTALRLVRSAGQPNLGVLFDTCHFSMGASHWHDLESLPPEHLKFVHINDGRDVPRELFQDSDRVPLGEGVFELKRIFDTLQGKGYSGYLSLELFNHDIWAMPVGEAAALLYRNAAHYLEPWLAGEQ